MNCVLLFGHSFNRGVYKAAGPFRLATELRAAGFSTQCIDVSSSALLEKALDKFITSETLWLGISTTFLTTIFDLQFQRVDGNQMEYTSPYLEDLIARCKARSPKIKFIIGGASYVNLEKYGFYSFIGFADTELVEFTRWCKDSSYSPRIQRLGKVITGTEYQEFSTSKIKWEKNDLLTPEEYVPLEVSRGCIFKCKFCAYPLNGKTKGEWVKRYEVLREELLYNYENFGTTRYMIVDDTYNDSPVKVRELYEQVYSRLPFKLDLTSYLRLDLMMRFPEEAAILRDSGYSSAQFGIETNNSASAKAVGKGVDFWKQVEYLHSLRENEFKNVLTQSGFIFGFPYDTQDSMQELKDFLLSPDNPLDDWHVKPLSINPVNQSQQKKYFSEFDLEHAKYGYKIVDDIATDDAVWRFFRLKWELPNGMNFDLCSDKAEDINQSSQDLPNFKFGAVDYCRMATIIPPDVVKTTSRKELKSLYEIGRLEQRRLVEYYIRLMAL